EHFWEQCRNWPIVAQHGLHGLGWVRDRKGGACHQLATGRRWGALPTSSSATPRRRFPPGPRTDTLGNNPAQGMSTASIAYGRGLGSAHAPSGRHKLGESRREQLSASELTPLIERK